MNKNYTPRSSGFPIFTMGIASTALLLYMMIAPNVCDKPIHHPIRRMAIEGVSDKKSLKNIVNSSENNDVGCYEYVPDYVVEYKPGPCGVCALNSDFENIPKCPPGYIK